MGDENLYDETSLLERPQRNVLHYHSTPEETPTYLVELPEQRIDAPRPSTQPRSRPRASTIVNTLHLADTREAEEQPLEEYVRRNISSFRKSISPDDLQRLTTPDRYIREEEVVSPATAEEIERDLMDSKGRKNGGAESRDGYEARESVPEEKPKKQRVTYQMDNPSEQNTSKPKHSTKSEDYHRRSAENPKNKHKNYNANLNDYSRSGNEVVVMPALEPVSVSQKNPFTKERKSSNSSSNKHSHPPTKVNVFIESSDDERFGDEKRDGKHHSKRGRSDPTSAKRKLSNDPKWGSFEQDNDATKKRAKNRNDYQQSEGVKRGVRESSDDSSGNEKPRKKSLDKVHRSRSSSVCLSGESGDSEPYMVNSPSRRDKHRDKKRTTSGHDKHNATDKDGTHSAKNRTSGQRDSAKRGRKSDDHVGYSKTTNPFGKEEPYSVHYVATQGGAAGKSPGKKPNEAYGKEKRGGKESDKKVPLKAPRSATKVVAKRRYHIQIPEHGRPETWFNVRFNMNSDNNVDMNYDGPVKINNYYASNNYT